MHPRRSSKCLIELNNVERRGKKNASKRAASCAHMIYMHWIYSALQIEHLPRPGAGKGLQVLARDIGEGAAA